MLKSILGACILQGGHARSFYVNTTISMVLILPGHQLGSFGAPIVLDDADSCLRIVEVVQMNPDGAVEVPGSLVGHDGIAVVALGLFGLGVLKLNLKFADY